METDAINNTNAYPPTIEELFDAMEDPSGKYRYLQILYYRNKSSLEQGFGQEYLVVNSTGYALYRLDDIDYSNGMLLIMLTNPRTGNKAEIHLDVNNEHPEHFLICWED